MVKKISCNRKRSRMGVPNWASIRKRRVLNGLLLASFLNLYRSLVLTTLLWPQ